MSTIHVMPIDDLVEHEYEDCVCGPTTEHVQPNGWVVVHHSLDGRELAEDDE